MDASGDSDAIFAPLSTIEPALAGALEATEATPALREAMRYAVLSGGKRLRPTLAWHCCAALGGRGEASLVAGVAVELVHCFSLVHDDLPALDNDDLRRGRPTLHRHAGEAMAILAGDALLNLAFEHVLMATIDDATRVGLLRTLARATSRMIVGQVADTVYDYPAELHSSLERLRFVHQAKTGALIEASCVMGAMCGLRDPARQDIVRRFGAALGLMFQAVDDLIDVTQTVEHTGKRTGKDAEAGKLTYPGVLGVDETRATIAALADDARACARELGSQGAMLEAVVLMMAGRTR